MSIYARLVSCSMRATLFPGKPLRQPGGVVSGFWRGTGSASTSRGRCGG